MDVVKLMGIERREYTDRSTGELKEFCGLHVVFEESDGDELEGKKCENFSCPREVDFRTLKLGQCYRLDYAHFKTKTGMGARISGLTAVEGK